MLFLTTDPDDESVRLLGQPKNNLGLTDLPTLTFRIESAVVAHTADGPVSTGRVNWVGETNRSIRDVLETSAETAETRTATSEAAAWLQDYLVSVGRVADSAKIKEEGKRAGHSHDALKRARARIRAVAESSGFPRRTFWRLPLHTAGSSRSNASGSNPGESALTALTAPTGQNDPPVGAVGAVSGTLQADAPSAGGVDEETSSPTACTRCGQRLLLHRPGRDLCEKCVRSDGSAA